MLRLAVIALLLANAGYYAWSHGWLRSWGLAPVEQSEPQRLERQIRPETLRILQARETPPVAPLGATEAPVAAAPAPSPVCLLAGPLDQRQTDAVRAAAAALPQGSWSLESTPIPGRWMVYMGRFSDDEALDKKRAELRARKVDFDRAGGTLELGLSLGRFSTEEAAQRGLTALNAQGVRTARVIQERQAATGFILKLPAVTDAQRQRWLATLRPAMAGKTLGSCS